MSSFDESNTIRCPRCGHVSITKFVMNSSYLGIMFEPTGDYFVCTNPACGVERIYGENAILMRNSSDEKKKE